MHVRTAFVFSLLLALPSGRAFAQKEGHRFTDLKPFWPSKSKTKTKTKNKAKTRSQKARPSLPKISVRARALEVPIEYMVSLRWDGNTSPNVIGYKLYFANVPLGPAPQGTEMVIDVGNVVQYTLTGISPRVPYFFKATAYDLNNNQSDFSEAANYMVPRITKTSLEIVPAIPPEGEKKKFVFGVIQSNNVKDLRYRIQHTVSLDPPIQWVDSSPTLRGVVDNSDGTQTATYESPVLPTEKAKFFRVIVQFLSSRVNSTSFAANSGAITQPFHLLNHALTQDQSSTGVNSTSGSATYTFDVPANGDYFVRASVNALNSDQNSFYVNIDAQPSDPAMIWDIPLTTGFETKAVAWRSTGTSPHAFTLSKGTHRLFIRGLKGGTKALSFEVVPTTETLSALPRY